LGGASGWGRVGPWDPFCFDIENPEAIVDRTTKTVNVVEFVTPDPISATVGLLQAKVCRKARVEKDCLD
jgi:hypothetical protein